MMRHWPALLLGLLLLGVPAVAEIITGGGGSTGGGGGGGAVTIADGADVALGSTTDAAGGTGTQTAISILKQLHLDIVAGGGGAVTIASGGVASGAYSSGSIASGAYASGSIASGAIVDLGSQADTACPTDNGSCSLIALTKRNNQNTAATGNVQGTGTAGTAATGVVTVQGIASGTPVSVSGTVTAGGVAQGSTTSGQTGPLTQCAVTTSAPTYTTAQTDPLSCDTAGNLRITGSVTAGGVAQGSTTSGQTGNLIQGAVTTAAPTYTTAQTDPLSLDTAGNLRVTDAGVAAAINSPVPTLQSGVTTAVTGCDTHAFYDASDNGLKTIVAGVSAKKIYICGYMLGTGGTATNLSLTSGTGSDCVSTSTAITPAWQMLANDTRGANSPFWNGLITLANADNLCVNASAGNAHQVEVWYTVQ